MITAKFLLLLLILVCSYRGAFSFVALKHPPALSSNGLKGRINSRQPTVLYYKDGRHSHYESPQTHSFMNALWEEFKKILPKSRMTKTTPASSLKPQTEPGCRYHLNLARSDPKHRQHEVATLIRVFPDMSHHSIEEIVTNANNNGHALIRVLSCKEKAHEIVEMLNHAHPPLFVEVFDAKREELVDV